MRGIIELASIVEKKQEDSSTRSTRKERDTLPWRKKKKKWQNRVGKETGYLCDRKGKKDREKATEKKRAHAQWRLNARAAKLVRRKSRDLFCPAGLSFLAAPCPEIIGKRNHWTAYHSRRTMWIIRVGGVGSSTYVTSSPSSSPVGRVPWCATPCLEQNEQTLLSSRGKSLPRSPFNRECIRAPRDEMRHASGQQEAGTVCASRATRGIE